MPDVTLIRSLFAHTLWADRIVLRSLEEVEEADLLRATGSSFGSVLGTVAHTLGAEQIWLSRFVGNPLSAVPGLEEYPDLTRLRAGFEDFWPEAEFFLASLTEEMLAGDLVYTNTQGVERSLKLWQALTHLTHHSSYHRGQVITLLRQMGYAPPSTDLLLFFVEKGPG